MKRYINNSRGGIACGFFKNWHLKMLQNLFIYIFLIFIAMFNYKFILFFFMFHFFRVYSYFKYINKEYKLSFYSRIINFFYISNFIFTIDTATLIGMFKWLFIDKGEIIKND